MKPEMAIELQRLGAILGKAFDKADALAREAHLDECYRKFGFLPLPVWREVVSWVIDHSSHRGLPYISEYQVALTATRKQLGYQGEGKARSCESCDGSGFKPAVVIASLLGMNKVYDAVEPCPLCNSNFTVPKTYHQPPITKVDGPSVVGLTERFIAEKTAAEPDYEQRVRRGWFSLWGFDSTGIDFLEAAKVIRERMQAGEISFEPKWSLKKRWAADDAHAKLVRQQANACIVEADRKRADPRKLAANDADGG